MEEARRFLEGRGGLGGRGAGREGAGGAGRGERAAESRTPPISPPLACFCPRPKPHPILTPSQTLNPPNPQNNPWTRAQQEVLTDGDHVNELHVCVAGSLLLQPPREVNPRMSSEDLMLVAGASLHGGGATAMAGPGEALGEACFFTEMPAPETVVTLCPTKARAPAGARLRRDRSCLRGWYASVAAQGGVRGPLPARQPPRRPQPPTTTTENPHPQKTQVLVVTRAAYDVVARDFPMAARAVLQNLQTHSERVADAALRAAGPEGAAAAAAAASAAGGVRRRASFRGPTTLPPLERVLRVRALVRRSAARADEARTNELLSAAAAGDVLRVRDLLTQGIAPDCVDYDRRSALMLAASKGYTVRRRSGGQGGRGGRLCSRRRPPPRFLCPPPPLTLYLLTSARPMLRDRNRM